LDTDTATGAEAIGEGRCDGKVIDEGVTDIPTTFPSRTNRSVEALIGPETVKALRLGATAPVTATGVTELPM
jgi:hypothetical protein